MNYQQQIPNQYAQQQQQIPQYGQQQQIPQYQQQIPQYGQQQQQIPQYGQQQQIPQYGQQQIYQQQMQPQNFKLLARGQGIDNNEYNAIITSATSAFNARMNPLSTGTAKLIKQMIGGEWFVFVCPVGEQNYDFSLSVVTGGDFLSFYVDRFHFQVCRLDN
jgi:hypothetical protein